MARITWLADALQDAGLKVMAMAGWLEAGGDRFDPVGVLIHHTGGKIGLNAPSLNVVRNGRPQDNPPLPGPLCQILIGRDGTCYLIASGKANHAGRGGPLSLIPKDGGNARLVGIELENNGLGEPYPPVQRATAEVATAVVLNHLGRPAANCWGHKEWAPGRKPDPLFDMNQFRSDVGRRMTGGTTVPKPPATEGANPYPAETAEGLQLLAEHAGYVGDRDWFGPAALRALHRLKNEGVRLALLVAQQEEAIALLKGSLDGARLDNKLKGEENEGMFAQLQAAGATISKLSAEAEIGQHEYERVLTENEQLKALDTVAQKGPIVRQVIAGLQLQLATLKDDLDEAERLLGS